MVFLRKDIPSEQVEAIAQEFVDKYGITIKNSDKPDGGIWTVLVKGFTAHTSESVAMKISEDPRVDNVQENFTFAVSRGISMPAPSPEATSSASQVDTPFKLVERDGAIYKEAADTNDHIAPSKLPQVKFIKGHPRAIPGEFIVILQSGTTFEQADTI